MNHASCPKVALSLRDRKRERGKTVLCSPTQLRGPRRWFITPPVAERQGYLDEPAAVRLRELCDDSRLRLQIVFHDSSDGISIFFTRNDRFLA